MKKITNTNKKIISFGIITAMAFVSLFGIQNAYAAISGTMSLGSTGSNVTELQTYLAKDASVYPSGRVTGYFGALTEAAVQKFQAVYGIVTSGTPSTTGYGRVGPQTLAKINALMGLGNSQTSWDTVPVLSGTSIQYGRTSATFSWTTNEPTQGHVYYDTNPLRTDEETEVRQLPYVSGTFALDSNGFQTAHTVTIQNLQANTLYYFMTRGVDVAGNMSMTWPSTFRTTQ